MTSQHAPSYYAATANPQPERSELAGKVQADVLAKLGPGVDAALIEKIVRRVVSQLK